MKEKTHILLVDDHEEIAETLIAYLQRENYEVSYARDGEIAMEMFRARPVDLIILDWMMPGLSGPEVIKEVRQTSNLPILMISARDDESDAVIGLELGADDYLRKPFGPREVVARSKALLRRTQGPFTKDEEFKIGDIEIFFARREVKKGGQEVYLTPLEFHILEDLVEQANMAVSRQHLMEHALGYENAFYDRTLDTHIKNLRKKLEDDPGNPKYIKTVRGVGFKLVTSNR